MEYKRLGDICNPKQWKTISTSDLTDTGYPVYGANGIIGNYKEYNHKNETILVTCRGATCGSVNITQPYSYVNGNAMALDNLDKNIDINYLYFYLTYRGFNDVISGSAQPQIIRSAIEKVLVPVHPIEWQNRLSTLLQNISKIRELYQKEIERLDELIKARFIEMFGNLESNTKKFPVKLLKDISEYWNGLTYKPNNVVESGDKGILVLRSSNIQSGELSFSDNVYVDCAIKDKHYVKENDILMCSRNGSARLVGKVALIKGLEKPTSFGAFMMIIRSKYYPFLKVYFEMPEFRKQLATGTSTINQITAGMLNSVKVLAPDMTLVEEYKNFCNQIDKSKLAVQKSLEKTQQLFDSLMQEYFG